MADVAQLGFSADTSPLQKAVEWLNKLKPAAIDAEQATDKLNRTGRNTGITTLASGAEKAAISLKSLALQIGATVAAGATLTAMINSAMQLNTALANVSTLLPTVGNNLKDIEAAAHGMAREFGTSAAQQVDSFYSILSAGISDVSKATDVLTVANKLAIGGVADIGTVTSGLTSIMNSYAGKVKDATDVSDALFVAAAAGSTDIQSLSSSLGQVTPIASSLGVSFDELAANVAALTNSGETTSEAVTSLRAILTNIAKPTTDAIKLSKALGIEFNTTGLASKGLTGFMQDVIAKTHGNSQALALLFGDVNALNGAMSLAGPAGKQLNGILDQMANKAGATGQAFNRVSDSDAQKVKVALGEIGDAGTIVGEKLLTAAVPGLEALGKAITDPKFLSTVTTFTENLLNGINAIAAAIIRTQEFFDRFNASAANFGNSPFFKWIAGNPSPDTLRAHGLIPRTGNATSGDMSTFAKGGAADKMIAGSFGQLNDQPTALAMALQASINKTGGQASAVGTGAGAGTGGKLPASIQTLMDHLLAGRGAGAGTKQDPYAKLITSGQNFIASQHAQASALGLSAEAASKMTHEQDLLNSAANSNIKLTTTQKGAINELAGQMAEAEMQTQRLTDIYNAGKGIVTGFLSDLNSQLQNGTSLWKAFANAALNALSSIASNLANTAGTNIWNSIFKGIAGGLTGNAFGSLGNDIGGGATFAGVQAFTASAKGNVFGSGLDAYRNSIVTRPTMFAFAQGSSFGLMGEKQGSPGEAIMPLTRTSSGDLGVKMTGSNDNGQVHYHDQRQYTIYGEKDSAQTIATMIRAYDNKLPDRLQEIQRDPHKRRISAGG